MTRTKKKDYEKNEKRPDQVLATLDNSYNFVCSNGHHFKCTLRELVENDFHCPVCEGKRVDPEKTSLQALNPELASEFSINNKSTASQIAFDTSKKVLWTCPTCGYTYKASVRDRVTSGDLCPACAGKKAHAGFNTLLDLYPEIQDECAENENALLGIFPDEILPTSNARVWWECKDCGRKYLLSVNMWVEKHIRGMTSCTYCSGLRMRETHVLL